MSNDMADSGKYLLQKLQRETPTSEQWPDSPRHQKQLMQNALKVLNLNDYNQGEGLLNSDWLDYRIDEICQLGKI